MKIIGMILVLVIGITSVYTGIRRWQEIQTLPVSEWSDVFDMDCECGNHLHFEPCDLEHYKIECGTCGHVYEKGWGVWQEEIDKWVYINE